MCVLRLLRQPKFVANVLHVCVVNSVLSELLFVARMAEMGECWFGVPDEIFRRHFAVWARLCRVADYFALRGVTSLTSPLFVFCASLLVRASTEAWREISRKLGLPPSSICLQQQPTSPCVLHLFVLFV